MVDERFGSVITSARVSRPHADAPTTQLLAIGLNQIAEDPIREVWTMSGLVNPSHALQRFEEAASRQAAEEPQDIAISYLGGSGAA